MLSKKFWLAVLGSITILLIVVLVTINRPSSPKVPFDHAPDYSWVIGELEYNPIEGGFWQIRFGNESAPYGGKFVLGKDPKLANFQSGDLVKITGKISLNQVSIFQAGTLYDLESIDLAQ